MLSFCITFSLIASLAGSAVAYPQFNFDQFSCGRGRVEAISRGSEDARKSGKSLPQEGWSYELFHSVQLGMKPRDVVALLGVPEKQKKVYEHLAAVVGTDKFEYRRFMRLGNDGVVNAERYLGTWKVACDENDMRSWGSDPIEGRSM